MMDNKIYIVRTYWDNRICDEWIRHSEKEAAEVMSDNCTFGKYKLTEDSDNLMIWEAGR